MKLADVHELAVRAGERERADAESYPAETIRELFTCGLIGAPFGESEGGSGWSCLDATKAIQTLAAQSPSVALIAAMPLGFAGVAAGTDSIVPPRSQTAWAEQVAAIAADFRKGKHYAACNSEAGAGGALEATKTVAEQGADGWRLTD